MNKMKILISLFLKQINQPLKNILPKIRINKVDTLTLEVIIYFIFKWIFIYEMHLIKGQVY